MKSTPINNKKTSESFDISNIGTIHYNLKEESLVEQIILHDEGKMGPGGSILVHTGKHTGRAPNDKYIVKNFETEKTIWWDSNNAVSEHHFDLLYKDINLHISDKECFVQDLYACANSEFRLNVRIISELAWHSLFMRHMLRSYNDSDLLTYIPDFTIVNCPSFKADPKRHGCKSDTIIAINFSQKLIIISGTEYAGENKKGVFTVLNYLMTDKKVMPMHCSANLQTSDEENVTIFFGLSGTGKTTLSSTSYTKLIGDDEHGWSDNGIFNFEGGCYAKTINLNPTDEPEIYATTSQFGTIIENMIFDQATRQIDFANDSITMNTRCAYPINYIRNSSATGMAGLPRNIIMLTCDAFGVLPPIASLTAEEAVYQFLSGFTSKIAGTEGGILTPQPTFSTCFGAPFLPRPPEIYAQLLKEKIDSGKAKCWLVNTGWTGGGYGVGSRISIEVTRKLISEAINGGITESNLVIDSNFGFKVPESVQGIPTNILHPKLNWPDEAQYDNTRDKLINMFHENFKQFEGKIDESILLAAVKIAF